MTARKKTAEKKTEKTADSGQVKVTVREGWAVSEGTTQHGGGAVLTVDRATANRWVRSGWVEPTD